MDYRDIAHTEKKWYKNLNQKTMTAFIEVAYEDEEDEYIEEKINIPFLYEVCDVCGGKGKHINPSIDCNGISGEEFYEEWSEEEREGYFSGLYDVSCYKCNGMRVVPFPDYDKMDSHLREIVENYLGELYNMARERVREMEMGY